MAKPKITPIEFTVKFRGEIEQCYCKPWMTAGDQVTLARGQKFTQTGGQGSMTVDLGDTIEKKQLFVALMRTHADGTLYYSGLKELQATEPAKKVNAMSEAITKATGEDDEEDEGNVE